MLHENKEEEDEEDEASENSQGNMIFGDAQQG